jgi:hypothetical protein
MCLLFSYSLLLLLLFLLLNDLGYNDYDDNDNDDGVIYIDDDVIRLS